MNLPLAVGAPITRTLQGTTYHFPRLNLREYGTLLQSWLDQDLARLAADLVEDNASEEESIAAIRRLKRTTRTAGYVARKLADWNDGSAIINLSLKKAGQSITADQLAMDIDDLVELCLELWSRNFLRIHRESQAAVFSRESQPPKSSAASATSATPNLPTTTPIG